MQHFVRKTDASLHEVRLANYMLVVNYLGGALGLAAEKMGLPPQLLYTYRRGFKVFSAADARRAEEQLGLAHGWMDESHRTLDPVPDVLKPLKNYKRKIANAPKDFERSRRPPPAEDVRLHGVRMANFALIVEYMGGALTVATKILGLRYSRIARYRDNRGFFETEDARTVEASLGCETGWMDVSRLTLDPVPEILRPYEDHKRVMQLRRRANGGDTHRASRLRLLFPRGTPRSHLICGALGLSPHTVERIFSAMPGHIAGQLESEFGLPRGWFDEKEIPTDEELSCAQEVIRLVERVVKGRLPRAEQSMSPEARALIARIAEMDGKGLLTAELAADVLGRLMQTCCVS